MNAPRQDPDTVVKLREAVLAECEKVMEAAPPEQGPRRFGNVAFRKWYALVEERVEGLLEEVLGPVLNSKRGEGLTEEGKKGLLEEVKGYFMGGWGSAQRLDYGTGHELSFLAFLGALWKLGVFEEDEGEKREEGDVERAVVFGVFEP